METHGQIYVRVFFNINKFCIFALKSKIFTSM